MPHQTLGLHHAHTRKRIHVKHEQFPSTDKFKNILDKAMYVIGALSPLMMIPQIYKIWCEKNGENISVVTWSTFALVSCFWILYGILHKEKQIIFIHVLIFLMSSIVVFLTFWYR